MIYLTWCLYRACKWLITCKWLIKRQQGWKVRDRNAARHAGQQWYSQD